MKRRLRAELVRMRVADERERERLLPRLGDGYHPEMAALHRRNAARLRELIDAHGWPDAQLVGDDGAEAAWFIAQHAIGEPAFQRRALQLVEEKVAAGRVPAWQAAYLFDRIAMYEGRPQRWGTQSLPEPDGEFRRWKTEYPRRLNQRRAAVGLPPAPAQPRRREPTARQRRHHARWLSGYERWLRESGWRSPSSARTPSRGQKPKIARPGSRSQKRVALSPTP